MTMPTPRDECLRVVKRWAGVYSNDPDDKGNWTTGRLVGSQYDVTGPVLAAHRGVPQNSIGVEEIRSITLEEAADIGVERFYKAYRLDTLPWGPATSIVLDFCWGSGNWGVKIMQRVVGVNEDGNIGPDTREAYVKALQSYGWIGLVDRLVAARHKFYTDISMPGTKNAKYRNGWYNRCFWQSPQSAEWWNQWKNDIPPVPAYTPSGARTDVTPVARPAAVPDVTPPPDNAIDLTKATLGGKTGVVLTTATVAGAASAIDSATELVTKGRSLFSLLGFDAKYFALAVAMVCVGLLTYVLARRAGKISRGETRPT